MNWKCAHIFQGIKQRWTGLIIPSLIVLAVAWVSRWSTHTREHFIICGWKSQVNELILDEGSMLVGLSAKTTSDADAFTVRRLEPNAPRTYTRCNVTPDTPTLIQDDVFVVNRNVSRETNDEGRWWARWVAGTSSGEPTVLFYMPIWPWAVPFVLWLIWRVIGVVRHSFPVAEGSCPVCGYDLRASPERCPECGTPRTDPTPAIT